LLEGYKRYGGEIQLDSKKPAFSLPSSTSASEFSIGPVPTSRNFNITNY
jgi:hypothetical protein